MAHAAAAFPGHIGLEVLDCGREQCLQYDSYIEDGYVVLGNAPGLGIEVDEEALRSLQENPPRGRGRFPFSRREGAARFIHPLAPGEVGWKHDNTP
jgi:hypothetical protein